MSAERLLFAALLAWLALRACTTPASAQVDERDAVALLRICVHEASSFSADDCAGIHSVIRHTQAAHSVSYMRAAQLESPRFFAGVDRRNAWARELALDCARPRSLRASWVHSVVGWADGTSRHERCLALAARVRALVVGPATCDATAWGSTADYERRRAQGCTWDVVDCGDTRNVFSRAMRCPRTEGR